MIRAKLKKKCWLAVSFCCFSLNLAAQPDTILYRMVLIGDGGELSRGTHPVVNAVKNTIPLDEKTTILFLGDNIYKKGLPDFRSSKYKKAKAILDAQLAIAGNLPARVYIIPGNHDWENGGRGGYEAVLRQQRYVDSLNKSNLRFFPENACPGPEEISLGNEMTLIIFDSQWWLHKFSKPGTESDCRCKSKEEVISGLKEIVSKNSGKLILIASHHPVKSHGIHGGYFRLKQHIFPLTDLKKYLYIPLPVIGSVYPLYRSIFGVRQDLRHHEYEHLIHEILNAVSAHPGIIFAAGHDHGLQLLKDGSNRFIVSGSGAKSTRVAQRSNTLYAGRDNGFCVLEVSANKKVTVSFYTVTASIQKTFSVQL